MNEVTEKQKVITYSVDVLIAVGIIALLAYFSLTLILPFLTILVWAAILGSGPINRIPKWDDI